MDIVEKAILFATHAHADVPDKNGEQYILHPLRVMLDLHRQGEPEYVLVAALLHDVVEDTPVTLDELSEKFHPFVSQIVGAVSRREGEKYDEFITRIIKFGPPAIKVKMADIRDNTDLHRVTSEHGMYSRYAKAYRRLKEVV